MAGYLLRKIEKNRWMPEAYVAQDDVPADALRDLQTGSNKLSVWLIEEDKSNLERIVVALAAMRNVLSNLDYALLDSGILDKINIKMSDSLGNSPDLTANSRWHRDLIELSALRIVDLAKAIGVDGEFRRVPEKTVAEWIRKALEGGQIEGERLSPDLSAKVRKQS